MHKEYLRRREAATYLTEKGLPVSRLTLQKLATTGGGPTHALFGNKALYTPAQSRVGQMVLVAISASAPP